MTGNRLRRVPVSWFYQDEPAPAPGPRLILRVAYASGVVEHEVPSRFHQDRFYCHSSDLARYLKSSVGRLDKNMFAPLHQVITMLGWSPAYDRSHLKDTTDPRLVVTVSPPPGQ